MRRLLGVLLLLAGLAALSRGPVVAAAPALSVTPTSGPVGTTFDVSGSGFPPQVRLTYAVIDPTGARFPGVLSGASRQADNTASASGSFIVITPWFAEVGESAGVYTATVALAADPANILASVTFTVVGSGGAASATVAGAVPSITVAPAAGPTGGGFTIVGEGLAATTTYVLVNTDANGIEAGRGQVGTDPNGRFSTVYHSKGDAPGAYTVALVPLGSGPALVTAAYTVRAPGGARSTATVRAVATAGGAANATATRSATAAAPATGPTPAAVPRAGGGGSRPLARLPWLAVLGAVVLTIGLAVVVRRRRATR